MPNRTRFLDAWSLLFLGSLLIAAPRMVFAFDDGTWQRHEAAPAGRILHGAAHDPLHDRMILFGGVHRVTANDYVNLNDVWELSLSEPERWMRIRPAGNLPPAAGCSGAAIVYDTVRDRIVAVLSGNGGVWALTLSGPPQWSVLAPTGIQPVTGNNRHRAIYDAPRDRMVLYGLGTAGNETWALALSGTGAWSQLASGGSPDGDGPIAYDAARDRMILYGGSNGSFWTWALPLADGSEWGAYPSGATNPGDVSGVLVYDVNSDRVVLQSNELWQLGLDPISWSPLAADSTPPANTYQTAIYDPVRDRMVLCAGDAADRYVDLWQVSLGSTSASTRIDVPLAPARGSQGSAILDAARDRLIVYSGDSEVRMVPMANPSSWSVLPAAGGPSPRLSHCAIADPSRDRMLVFGGVHNGAYANDVWKLALDGSGWTQVVTAGSSPAGRSDHSAIRDPVRDRMIVFGGFNSNALGDLWSLSLSGTPQWSPLGPTGPAPSPRHGHTAVYDAVRDRMLVFGGRDAAGFASNEVWALSLSATPAWSQLTTVNAPPAVFEHSAIYDPISDRMMVFGGYRFSSPSGYVTTHTVYALDLAANLWQTMSPTGETPFSRGSHATIFDPLRRDMVVFGGYHDGGYQGATHLVASFADIHVLNLSTTVAVGPSVEPARSTVVRVAPNPGAGPQSIEFQIASDGAGRRIEVVDLSGRIVWSAAAGSGAPLQRMQWNGRNAQGGRVAPGVYFARLAGSRVATRFTRLK